MQPTLALVGPTSPTPTQRMDADDLVALVEEEDKQWANMRKIGTSFRKPSRQKPAIII